MQKAEMICPDCGTKIESWENQCRSCGYKRKKKSGSKGFKIATFLLALLLLAGSGLYWHERTGYEKQISGLGTLEVELNQLKARMADNEDTEFYKEEYEFFCERVCVWQDDGTNLCHMYGCQYVDMSRWDFIIINQEGAITRMNNGMWRSCTACVPHLVRGSFQYAYWRNQQTKGSAYPNT